jgi:hypothetical protein
VPEVMVRARINGRALCSLCLVLDTFPAFDVGLRQVPTGSFHADESAAYP